MNLDIINQIKNSEKVDNNLVNRSVELEKIMMDNLNGLEEYLVSWAELDKNDSDDLYSRVIIRSIFIVSTCIIVFLLIFSFAIGQVVWIYLDSKKREDKWGILWSILAITPIFLPILLPLPLIVYLLVTRAFSTKCPNCKVKISSKFSSCPSCGCKLKEKCKSCGSPLKDEWKYCPYCNDKIEGE